MRKIFLTGLVSIMLAAGLAWADESVVFDVMVNVEPAAAGDIKGIMLTSQWDGEYQSPDAEDALVNLTQTGANYVGILATWYMDTTPEDGEYSKLNIIYSHPQKTPSDADLIYAINAAKDLGKKVMLKLQVRVVLNDNPYGDWEDRWAGNINPSDPDEWLAYYAQFAAHYAALCEDNGVDILCFGTELTSMTKPLYETQWDSVIDTIRAGYSGKLTFSSNMYQEYEQIPFWERCDYLGIGPYFSLTSDVPDPGLDAIVDGWSNSPIDGRLMEKLETWQAQYNKPVLFTEIGYCSVDSTPYQPWKGTQGLPENWSLQKKCFDALFLSFQNKPWLAGVFWWKWLCDPDAGLTGLERKEYTPQNKDAQKSIENFYAGINPDDVSYIKIVDGEDNELLDGMTLYIGHHKNLYARAYDSYGQILGYIPCVWSVLSSGGVLEDDGGALAILRGIADGVLTVRAAANGNSDSVENITVVQRYLRVPSEYSSIQSAMDAAERGDIILISPGEYNESINVKDGVSLKGISGPEHTKIIGGLTIAPGANENTIIQGLTITNPSGCGISATQSSPKIYNNVIEGNSGGGIHCDYGAPEIINNVIINNFAQRGAGIYVLHSNGRIFNNIIMDNQAAEYGGGIKGWELGPGFEIGYNDVWNNTAGLGEPDYGSCPSGEGAIGEDPLFSGLDYRLSDLSPCVDTGHPDSKYNDIDGTRNDMGIHGGPYAGFTPVNRTPQTGNINPKNGSSLPDEILTFEAGYKDPEGPETIQHAMLRFLIRPSPDERKEIRLCYFPATERLYIGDYSAGQTKRWYGPYAAGSSQVIDENPHIRLYCDGSRGRIEGDQLKATWKVSFKNASSGRRYNMYLYAKDLGGATTDMDYKGTWTVNPDPPQTVDVTPKNSSSLPDEIVSFEAGYKDPQGPETIKYGMLRFWIKPTPAEKKDIRLCYFPATNMLYIGEYSAGQTKRWYGPYIAGSTQVIDENPHIRLYCDGSGGRIEGDELKATWKVSFKAPFAGMRYNMYLYARDLGYATTRMDYKGTWTINHNPPQTGDITPKNSSSLPGEEVVFTATYIDPDGWDTLLYGLFRINTTTSNKNCFFGYYNQKLNKLYLRNDSSTAWLGGYAPGSQNIIQNSYARLDCSKTTAQGSGKTLTVSWAITFKQAFAGNRYNMYLYAKDLGGLETGWKYKGEWTVTNADPPLMPSIVTTDGFKLMVQKRNFAGMLEPAAAYTMKGVCWSPAGKGILGPERDEDQMRSQFGAWCDTDIPLIKEMNANTVRTFMDFGFSDEFAKDWRYVLDKCYINDIMVILTVDRAVADLARVVDIVNEYKDHPAVLMWLVGNEWNINNFYGAFPDLYAAAQAAEDAAVLIKSLDSNHPVASSLGDPNYPSLVTIRDIIINQCPSVDVWGFNVYRGASFTNLFDQWKSMAEVFTEKPMFLGEFGCDAYDINMDAEDQPAQRNREYHQWDHIRSNLSAEDNSRVCAGACVFEFNDEWWKVRDPFDPWTQQKQGWNTPNSPDSHASEEWWGIVDIDRIPRLAYQLFKEFFGGVEPEPPLTP